MRDIDPSHVNRPPPDRDEGAAAAAAFWDPPGVTAWHPDVEDRAWAAIRDDLPPIETLLFSRDAPSGSEWVNLHAEMRWAMPRPAHADGANDPRREIWLHLDGALVRRSDLSQLGSARVAERLRHGAQSSGSLHELYLGEISGSQASRFFHDPYYAHLGWAAEVQGLGIEAITTSQGYLRERGAFDCSFETPAVRFRVPTDTMLSLLQARWSGISATYQQTSDATQPFDTDVPVVAFDPSVHVQGPSAFLVRRTALLDVLRMHDLSVCWLVHGEKLDAAGAPDHDIHARTSFHGLFLWDGTAVSGRFVFGKIEASDADARD